MRIDLPPQWDTCQTKAHSYPYRIAIQTMEFVQASLMHTAFMDTAAGSVVRSPGGFASTRLELTWKGLERGVFDEAWSFIEKYQAVFSQFPVQYALISMKSHWDWYVSRLGAFVEHGRATTCGPNLGAKQQRALSRIGFKPIVDQVRILEESCGVCLGCSSSTVDAAREMTLTRNLGIHNRWEVDARYAAESTSGPWKVGEIRIICQDEIWAWHGALLQLISGSWSPVAQAFRAAPDFPPGQEDT